ncbi:hypothetical protein KVR01_011718 [Diaporthe batatas]|uniref:uncharacterized protein n=1 Tax=Diaporthe batatas TaxID=748121 RepID=UPI001D057D9B|nr:uncharacterized protein KVR01_011718 [Diaporthe batatas]KAG8158596.1 hypothetical protein KVR01_011718 [Diaporthe batatas]
MAPVLLDEAPGMPPSQGKQKEPPTRADPKVVSIGPAPLDPVPAFNSRMYLQIGILSGLVQLKLGYWRNFGQKTHCIRSQTGDTHHYLKAAANLAQLFPPTLAAQPQIGVESEDTITSISGNSYRRQEDRHHFSMASAFVSRSSSTISGFPYPKTFMAGLKDPETSAPPENLDDAHSESRASMPIQDVVRAGDQQTQNPPEPEIHSPEWEFGDGCFGIGFKYRRPVDAQVKSSTQQLYVNIGLFPRGHVTPVERLIFVSKPEYLFWKLQWAAFRLRGWTGALLSLRHVQEFKLYQCDVRNGSHERVQIDEKAAADLRLLLLLYRCWHVPPSISREWARWIHEEFNCGSNDVLQGRFSIELVLGWSSTRITIVVLLPVLLSLVVGLWMNSQNWTDLATIQTAWGTASYIVTAGGLTAALLGILSSIVDK